MSVLGNSGQAGPSTGEYHTANPLPFRTDGLCSEPAESRERSIYRNHITRFLVKHDGLKRFYKDQLNDVVSRAKEMGDQLRGIGCTAEFLPSLSLLTLYNIVVLIGAHSHRSFCFIAADIRVQTIVLP